MATLLKIYQTNIKTGLWMHSIYGTVRTFYLQLLDTVQNSALLICLGAYRTSPAAGIQVESTDFPLELRLCNIS